jgi:hypothetical protein
LENENQEKINRTSEPTKQPKKTKIKSKKKKRTKTKKINALHPYSPLMTTAQSQTRAGYHTMVSRATMSVKLDFTKQHLPFPALVSQLG